MHARLLARSLATGAAVALVTGAPVWAQSGSRHPASASLADAPTITLVQSGDPVVDSNSPVVWDRADGVSTMFVLTSFAGAARVSAGEGIGALSGLTPIDWDVWPLGGAWMEAVIPAPDGTWYGFYHNEVQTPCAGDARVQPRIGAARSTDQGRTWTNLGIVLDAPAESATCDSPNRFFTGGVGDFSVVLSPDAQDLYLFYSAYLPDAATQGVAVARLAWADRDAPVGRLAVWSEGVWQPVEALADDAGDTVGWRYPVGTPIFTTSDSWHDGQTADAFWGPSVHYNTHLEQYVMLLNRTAAPDFSQEGIYVAFAPALDAPGTWTAPQQVLRGGQWYPQIIGLEREGTDKVGGETVRLFVNGVSSHLLTFTR